VKGQNQDGADLIVPSDDIKYWVPHVIDNN
jgi:hypothetical protein